MGTRGKTGGRGPGTVFRDRAQVFHERPGLAKRTRHLINISILTLLGRSADLTDAMHWALDRRVGSDLIREAILQTFLFAGYPRALHAFEVFDAVLEDRGLAGRARQDRLPPRASLPAFFRRRGRALFEEIYRGDANLVMNRIRGFQPEFMDWIIEDAYGKVLSRPYLDLKTREILSSALLTVLRLPRQLTPHMRGAIRAGARPAELSEAIGQLELFLAPSKLQMARVRLERARTSL